MTKTELDDLEQKYLLWKDTPTAQQILQLIRRYRNLEQQIAAKNELVSPCQYRTRAVSKGESSIDIENSTLKLFEDEQ